MKNGPISAATSATINAIANPSRVVCTAPSGTIHRRRDRRRNRASYKDKCGEVTTMPCDRWTPSPLRRQCFQAAQHESRPPFRGFGVNQFQIWYPPQQGRNRDTGFQPRQLGAEAEMDAAAE